MEEQIALGVKRTSITTVTAEQIVEWRDRVYRLALAIVCNKDAAEDVAQETISRAIRFRWQINSPDAIEAWLRKICVRQSINVLRSKKFELMDEDIAVCGDDTTNIAVRQTLQLLKPEQSAILALYHYEGLTYQEIAVSLGVPIGTVASRLSNAKVTFRNLWEEHNDKR